MVVAGVIAKGRGPEMIYSWLALPLPAMLATMGLGFAAIAILLFLLSFVLPTRQTMRSFRGVVAPFVGTVAVIFGILLGFLANDVWDRERRAGAAVRSEAENLLAISKLSETFGLPHDPLAGALRSYIETVVRDEWPSMRQGESTDSGEAVLEQLLRTISQTDMEKIVGGTDLHRLLIDAGLGVRAARSERLRLSRDGSAELKWLLVLVLAAISQIAVAIVHLESPRPQIAALTLWTASVIFVIGLLAANEWPFSSPNAIEPEPLQRVLIRIDAAESAAARPPGNAAAPAPNAPANPAGR
jgi:hypothetical protein